MNVTTPNAPVTLSGLIPFADYRVSVKCIWLGDYDSSNLTPHGYWSDAADVSFTTRPDGRSIVLML